MIPYSRPKLSDLCTLSQSKLLENHALHSSTYPYSPYMAVPPPPSPGPAKQSSLLPLSQARESLLPLSQARETRETLEQPRPLCEKTE